MTEQHRAHASMPSDARVQQPPTGPRHAKPEPTTPHVVRGRLHGLDGARGIATVCVVTIHVAAHYSPSISAGAKLQLLGQALIFFFALSGFLLYRPMVRNLFLGRAGQPDVRAFTIHRVLRIFPGYLVIFLITNFALQTLYLTNAWQTTVVGSDSGTGMITDPVTLIANLTLVQTYIPGLLQTGLNPSWSLTLEIAFYICLPLVGAAMFAVRRRRPSWGAGAITIAAPVVLLVVGLVGRGVGEALAARSGITELTQQNFGPYWAAVVLRSFFANCDQFAYGMAAAVIFVAVEAGDFTPRVVRRIRRGALAVVPVALVAMLAFIALGSNFQVTFMALASGAVILVIVLPLAIGLPSKIADLFDFWPFERIGTISLSVYLWHFPVLLVLGRWGLMAGDSWGGLARNWLLVMVVTVVLSTITYRCVEKPAMGFARRLSKR